MFESAADNLVAGDTNAVSDVFRCDTTTGSISLVSATSGGAAGSGASTDAWISKDGKWAAFVTEATNLVDTPVQDNNGAPDIVMRDLEQGTNLMVTLSQSLANPTLFTSGVLLAGPLVQRIEAISGDGRRLLYQSLGTNLMSSLPPNATFPGVIPQVYWFDRETGTNQLAYRENGYVNRALSQVVMSGDGSTVILSSRFDFLANVPLPDAVLFARAMPDGPIVRVPGPDAANPFSAFSPLLSGDGGLLYWGVLNAEKTNVTSFITDVARLLAGDTVSPVTLQLPGQSNFREVPGFISPDGSAMLFRVRPSVLPDPVAFGAHSITFKAPPEGVEVDSASADLSVIGTTVYPVPGQSGGSSSKVALYSGEGYSVAELVSEARRSAGPSPIQIISSDLDAAPFASADGRRFVFASFATNLASGSGNGFLENIFVRDTVGASNILVSIGPNGEPANGHSLMPSISADGRFVVFVSHATNLVEGDTNRFEDVFIRDLDAGVTMMVNSPEVVGYDVRIGDLGRPMVSGEGRFVAFNSVRRQFVRGVKLTQSSYYLNVFDRQAHTNYFVVNNDYRPTPVRFNTESRLLYLYPIYDRLTVVGIQLTVYNIGVPDDPPGSSSTGLFLAAPRGEVVYQPPQFSADFAAAAWYSFRGSTGSLSYWTKGGGVTKLLTVDNGTQRSLNQFQVSISPDGSKVAFATPASLVAGDQNRDGDVYLLEVAKRGAPILLSNLKADGTTEVGFRSAFPRFSPDGKSVYFRSWQTNGAPPIGASSRFFESETRLAVRVLTEPAAKIVVQRSRLLALTGGPLPVDDLIPLAGGSSGITYADSTTTSASSRDLLFLPTEEEVDSDHDGLPDFWERAAFGDLSQSGGADFDGDGMSNLAEYLAGTDPARAASVLHLEIFRGPEGPVIHWDAPPGRTFILEFKPDLSQPVWTPADATKPGFYRLQLKP